MQIGLPSSGTAIEVPDERRDRIVAALLQWYAANKRNLPWRGASPYAVWVSEIMLQQTQVTTVIPYFLRFMESYPTLSALAVAPIDDVLHHWSGLGYYARARNLHLAAQLIVRDYSGTLPNTSTEIERLPGIGRYTAGAILSIAFGQRRPIVDGNVIRVLSRVFGLYGDPKSTPNQNALWSLAGQLVDNDQPGEFNQSLMELGALVCRPDEPQCERCPLLCECHAGNSPDPTALPEIPAGRAAVNVIHASAICLESALVSNGPAMRTAIVRRPLHGLWGGLWEFPRVVCNRGEEPTKAAIRAALETAHLSVSITERLAIIKHSVTHHRITLHGFLAQSDEVDSSGGSFLPELQWVEIAHLDRYAFAAPQALLRNALLNRVGMTGHSAGQIELPFGDP